MLLTALFVQSSPTETELKNRLLELKVAEFQRTMHAPGVPPTLTGTEMPAAIGMTTPTNMLRVITAANSAANSDATGALSPCSPVTTEAQDGGGMDRARTPAYGSGGVSVAVRNECMQRLGFNDRKDSEELQRLSPEHVQQFLRVRVKLSPAGITALCGSVDAPSGAPSSLSGSDIADLIGDHLVMDDPTFDDFIQSYGSSLQSGIDRMKLKQFFTRPDMWSSTLWARFDF